MAKRAMEPEKGSDEVIDLNNDARWQARLDEARARRAEALKKQGREDKPQRAPRKPWEDEAETSSAAVKHQRPLDHDGLDFHDRMNALHKVLKQSKGAVDETAALDAKLGQNWLPEQDAAPEFTHTKEPLDAKTVDKKPKEKPAKESSVDSLFDDPAFSEPLAPVEPELNDDETLPISALVAPLPPREPARPSRPWLNFEDEAEEELDIPPVEVSEAPKQKEGGIPFLLGVGLVALLALPFFNWLPPLERGPDPTASPVFGVQPAFGITAAMVEFPALTTRSDFVPASVIAPNGPVVMATPATPDLSRTLPSIASAPDPQSFEEFLFGSQIDHSITRKARESASRLPGTQLLREARFGVSAAAGHIPAVLAAVDAESLTPIGRP